MKIPQIIFVVSLVALWLAARSGAALRKRRSVPDDEREDFGIILGAVLTLLGLIIGFSFSMAIGRYDQRKNYEEAEANAIGTEYVRADLLPAADAAAVKALLRKYLDQRILFYTAHSEQEARPINAYTAQIQSKLWAGVRVPVAAQPTPLATLAVAGMNDVLNSQGYTQAAWWNRIPTAAWILMVIIAICSNLLIGYGGHGTRTAALLFLVVPFVVSMSFFLIADIDSPRHGVILVRPQNLMSLAQSLQVQQ